MSLSPVIHPPHVFDFEADMYLFSVAVTMDPSLGPPPIASGRWTVNTIVVDIVAARPLMSLKSVE